MKKLFLFLFTFIVVLCSVSFGYVIVDNNVVYENAFAKLNVFPATTFPDSPVVVDSPVLKQTFIAEKKVAGSHDIFIGYVFDAPLRYGKIEQLVAGEWVDRSQYMLVRDVGGKRVYYSEFPLTFSDANPVFTWRIEYTPALGVVEGKWDLVAWQASDREDIFSGGEDWNILLDPWFNLLWGFKQNINIASGSALDQNFTVVLSVDTASLVSAGKLQGDCDDLRVVFQDVLDLNRFVQGCNQVDTNVFFRLQNEVAGSVNDLNYFLYYGNPVAVSPPDENRQVFRLSEFDRVSASLDNWSRVWNEDSSELQAGVLHLNKDNGATGTNWEGYCFVGDNNTFKDFVLSYDLNGSHYASNMVYDYNGCTVAGCEQLDLNTSISAQLNFNSVTYYRNKPSGTLLTSNSTGISWNNSDYNHVQVLFNGSDDLVKYYQGSRLVNTVISTQASTWNPGTICFVAHGNATDSSNFFVKNVQLRNIVSSMPVVSLEGAQENTFLSLVFRDENTNALINPTTLTLSINGSDVNSWVDSVVNGELDINALNYDSGKWVFVYGKEGYGTRTFMYDVNNLGSSSFVLGMLNDVNGVIVDFKFYNQNATVLLSDANIEVRDSSNRIAGRSMVASDGSVSFYLNPNDAGYFFNVNDVNGSDYNYSLTKVTVKQPLNELTLVSAGAFRIRTAGLSSYDLNNLSADTNIWLLNNTVVQNVIKISNVDANYFDRYYYLKFLGETESYVLQPYLLSGDEGSLSNFVALERFTQITIPGVILSLKKLLSGESVPVLVERIETDAVGNALFVVKFNDQYILDINYGSFFASKSITPILTSHEVVIDTGQTVDFNVEASSTTVSWNPNTFLSESGGFYSVVVDVNSQVANIVQIDVNIFNDGVEVVTDGYAGGAVSSYAFSENFSLVDVTESTVVQVTVYYVNGRKAFFSKSYNVDSGVSWFWVTGLNGLWEDIGQPGTLFVVTLLSVVITGLIGRFFDFNKEYAFGFAAFVMGFFCLLGAIQWVMWISVSTFSFFLLMLRRQLNV